MSFSANCKNEICENKIVDGCCLVSHLYGIISFAKMFSKTSVIVSSENETVFEHILGVFFELGIELNSGSIGKNKRESFISITDLTTIDRMMNDFGYSGDEPNFRIKDQNFLCDRCVKNFISGCFLTGGTISDPEKGYHLEFSSHKSNLINDFMRILTEAGFSPRNSSRNYSKLLYFKDSGQIEDILAYMGATECSFELMNAKIYKDILNNVNRATNCESANIDRALDSSQKDRALIAYIYKTMGKNWLPEELAMTASLRFNNPELSVSDIVELLPEKISKSGVNHRLRKIRAEAQRLKEQSNE
ncbi:MAG: DNA-binding protein WhiA [Oscillospiraceae bacterium]